jgi:hypothetical protein
MSCYGQVIETYLLNLVLPEVWDAVYYDPWERSSEVKGFVQDEGHDSCRQDIIAHPCVPCEPHLLKEVELDVVLGDFLKRPPVGILRHWRQDRSCVPEKLSVYGIDCQE